MSWTSIPPELQLHIITYLNREDCKNLRLTTKANANAVTSRLFEAVHLTPNTRSFDRARNIATSAHLAHHVRAVVYHLGVLEDIHNGYQNFRDDIMRIHHPVGSFDDITKDILWKYNCFLEEMDGQRDFETRNEVDEVKYICQRLDNLESITTVLDEDDPFSPPLDFIGRRTGVQSACSAEGPHFSSLFNASANKNLTTIRGWSMSWRCLPHVTDGALEQVNMSNLTELAVGLFNSEYLEIEESEQVDVLEALDAFLAAAGGKGDFKLSLDFDEIPFEAISYDLQEISEVVFKQHWPSLQDLSLQGIAATEDEIVHFLSKHSDSLKILHLDDIDIVDDIWYDVDGNEESLPGSVVSLFRRIVENLKLESASISGNFTNRKDESWFVDIEAEGVFCLRRDIELWLSHRAPAPFPVRFLYGKKGNSGQDFAAIEDSSDDADGPGPAPLAVYSDESWMWDLDLVASGSDDS